MNRDQIYWHRVDARTWTTAESDSAMSQVHLALHVSADSFAQGSSRGGRYAAALDSPTITVPRSWLVPQANPLSPLHRRAVSNRRNTYLTSAKAALV